MVRRRLWRSITAGDLAGKTAMIQRAVSFSASQSGLFAFYRLSGIYCFAVLLLSILASCGHGSNKPLGTPAPVLLFNGTGVSSNDVTAIQTLLDNDHLNYSIVSSSEMNLMSQSQLMKYRLLIVPGGDFINMGRNLSISAAANIRYAVQHGLNYLGICAGAFLAGSSAHYNGFNLTHGATFEFYSAEKQGITKAVVAITSPGAPTLDQYWENGPQLSGWGVVAAKYPDGTPAVTQGKCGSGHLILVGIHAEAPAYWRRGMGFNTPSSVDNAYAAKLIHIALNGASLPHY